jgi:HSP20 family protein
MPKKMLYNLRFIQGSRYKINPSEDEPLDTEAKMDAEPPLMDLYETPETIVVEMDIPGMDPRSLKIHLQDNRLVIEGRPSERCDETEKVHYIRMERSCKDFYRTLTLPAAVNPQEASMRYERGVLILRLPRIEEKRKRVIRIEVQ